MYDEIPSEFAPLFDTASNTSNALTGAFIAGFILGLLVVLALLVIYLIGKCKMFKKAGEDWWKGLIPLYDFWVEARIGGLAWWWFLIYVAFSVLNELVGAATLSAGSDSVKVTMSYTVSMAATLTFYNYNYNICKKFGKSGGFALLCTLLPFIGYPILGLGSAKYDKSIKTDQNGIFAVK